MMPQVTLKQRLIIVGLIVLGFLGLFGARELALMAPPLGAPRAVGPLFLAALGTFCFIAAGLMARKLMR
jgi:hypothetical protein